MLRSAFFQAHACGMAQTAVTLLVRLSTGRLEEYAVDSMPPYLAVSHTWADGLFDCRISFAETSGGQVLLGSIDSPRQSLPDLEFCWVDTFCIDQASEDDKRRQIPLMGDIYSNAVSLAVMLPYPLQTCQTDVDRLAEALYPAFKVVEDDDWTVNQTELCMGEPLKSLLTKALYGISHLVRGSWATRVWTAQEFLLAKSVTWIGTDRATISVPDAHFYAIITIFHEYFSIEHFERLQKLKLFMWPLLLFRLQDIDRTRFITQISERECSVPQDMIYGAMAASGVTISVGQGQQVEDIWRLWWEAAIKQQHVRWACCAIMWKTAGVPPVLRSYNCAMPPFEVRQIASDVLSFNHVERLGPVKLKNGTVSLSGYDVGVCKIVAHLGHYHTCVTPDGLPIRAPNLTFVLWAQGNFTLAFRIATALSAGCLNIKNLLLVAQVLKCNYSKAVWAVKHNKADSFNPMFRSYRQFKVYAFFNKIQGHELTSVAGTGLEVYLANVSNTVTSTDVAILMPGKAPQGEIRALDFNLTRWKAEFAARFLTIVKTPAISSSPNLRDPSKSDTLHKVGVTLPVKFSSFDVYGQHDFEGGKPQPFHIGGDSCTLCRVEKPERAPETLTSDIQLYTGPEPLCRPNIQIKPRVRASPFDPRRTRRPSGMVSFKYLWKHMWRTQWYEYDCKPLPQYPEPRRWRSIKGRQGNSLFNHFTRTKVRSTEANKKFPSSITDAELRTTQKEYRKKRKSSE